MPKRPASSTESSASALDRLASALDATFRPGRAPTLGELAQSVDLSDEAAIEVVYSRGARTRFHPTRKRRKSASKAWLLAGRLVPARAATSAQHVVLEDAIRALRTPKSTCFALSRLSKEAVFSRLASLLSGPDVRGALLGGEGPSTLGVLRDRGQPVVFLLEDIVGSRRPGASSRATSPVGAEAEGASPLAVLGSRAQQPMEGTLSAPRGSSQRPSASFGERFEAAFRRLDESRGARNFLLLREMREALSDVPRTEFDAGLRDLRTERRFTLLGFDGRHVTLSEADLNAGIVEGQRRLVYVSRKR